MVMLALGAWNSGTRLNAVKQIAARVPMLLLSFTVRTIFACTLGPVRPTRDLLLDKSFTAGQFPLIQSAPATPKLKCRLFEIRGWSHWEAVRF